MKKTFTPLLGNAQKLDGGAMFGHVPKTLWEQWMPPDEKNRITLACRALLVQEPHRNILLETGIGVFFEPALQTRYGVESNRHLLLDALAEHGLQPADIDVVIISHLHFDHAGGLLTAWEENKPLSLAFPNAQVVVGDVAWQRAKHPHIRDRASFIPELQVLLESSGRLRLVTTHNCPLLGDDYHFRFSHGHTPGLMHAVIHRDNDSPIIFTSDLIPGVPWLHLPVTMGYDRSPEQLIDEKQALLEEAIRTNAVLFFTHDPETPFSKVGRDAKGKYQAVKVTSL